MELWQLDSYQCKHRVRDKPRQKGKRSVRRKVGGSQEPAQTFPRNRRVKAPRASKHDFPASGTEGKTGSAPFCIKRQ